MPSLTQAPAPLTAWRDWNPRDYFDDYFRTCVDEDEREAIPFQTAFLRQHGRQFDRAIEFGCGPTLMRAIGATPYVRALDMADLLPANLERVRAWLSADPGADDWGLFTDYTLRCEGIVDPDGAAIAARERATRAVVDTLFEADALDTHPLGPARQGSYDLLLSSFCLDSLTESRRVWRAAMRNVFGLVRPGGSFMLWALRGCARYRVGDRWFPSANLRRLDLHSALLECGADPRTLWLEERALPTRREQGYDGMLMVAGTVRRRSEAITSRAFGR